MDHPVLILAYYRWINEHIFKMFLDMKLFLILHYYISKLYIITEQLSNVFVSSFSLVCEND